MEVTTNASVTAVQSIKQATSASNQSISNSETEINNTINNGIRNDSSNDQKKETTRSDEKNSSQNLTEQDLKKVIEMAQKLIEPHQTDVELKLDDRTAMSYVQFIDKDTKQVIGEVPSKQLLDIHAQVLEKLGLLVDKKV